MCLVCFRFPFGPSTPAASPRLEIFVFEKKEKKIYSPLYHYNAPPESQEVGMTDKLSNGYRHLKSGLGLTMENPSVMVVSSARGGT